MFQATILAVLLSQPPAVPNGPPPIPDGPPIIKVAIPMTKRTTVAPSGSHLLFVKVEQRPVGNLTTHRDDSAYERSGVYWVTASSAWRVFNEQDPEPTVRELEVSRLATPFQLTGGRSRLFGSRRGELRRLTVDDDRNDPRFADLLQGMEPYETATKTQTTFRRVTGYITPSSRTNLPNKWNVPGHLDGVEGWSSKLYKNHVAVAQVFLTRQDPFDSVSAVTWSRSYPDGTIFADVLRGPTGQVFEVRVATKGDGGWDRFTPFSDPSARPPGYHRPTANDCRACHHGAEQPGTSAYGGAAIPGADSVFSDPFDLLEAGRVVQGGSGTRL